MLLELQPRRFKLEIFSFFFQQNSRQIACRIEIQSHKTRTPMETDKNMREVATIENSPNSRNLDLDAIDYGAPTMTIRCLFYFCSLFFYLFYVAVSHKIQALVSVHVIYFFIRFMANMKRVEHLFVYQSFFLF